MAEEHKTAPEHPFDVTQDDLEKMSRAKVRTMLFDYIEVFYNRQRAHSSLGFLSPVDFENARSTT